MACSCAHTYWGLLISIIWIKRKLNIALWKRLYVIIVCVCGCKNVKGEGIFRKSSLKIAQGCFNDFFPLFGLKYSSLLIRNKTSRWKNTAYTFFFTFTFTCLWADVIIVSFSSHLMYKKYKKYFFKLNNLLQACGIICDFCSHFPNHTS